MEEQRKEGTISPTRRESIFERPQRISEDLISGLINLLEVGGENEIVSGVDNEHKIYARLIDDTYAGKRENYGKWKFKSSLNVENIFFTPSVVGGAVFSFLETYLPNRLVRAFQHEVQQDGSVRPRGESIDDTFLSNLIRFYRERLDDGRYLFGEDNRLIQVRETGRFVGERLTAGEDRLLPVRELMRSTTTTRRGEVASRTFQVARDTDTRTFVVNEEDILREGMDLLYKPNIPFGFASLIPTAVSVGLAIENMRSRVDEPFNEILSGKIAPRINHYSSDNENLFTIRGTAGFTDVVQDITEGITETTGLRNQILDKKIDKYLEYIKPRIERNKKTIIAGHSLGSLELSHIVERLDNEGVEVESYGFAHPVFKPHSKVTRVYSFDNDPLHNNDGANNHKVLSKGKMSRRFNNYHSTKNFYL